MPFRFILTLTLLVNTFCILNAQNFTNFWGIANSRSLYDLGCVYNYSVKNDTNTVVTFYDSTHCYIYDDVNKYRVATGLTIGPDYLVYGASRMDSARKGIIYSVDPSKFITRDGHKVNKIEIVHEFEVPLNMMPYWASNDSLYVGIVSTLSSLPPPRNRVDIENQLENSESCRSVIVKTDTSFSRIDTLFSLTGVRIKSTPVEGKDGSLYVISTACDSRDTLTRVSLFRLNKSTGTVIDSSTFPLKFRTPNYYSTHFVQDGGNLTCAPNGHIFGFVSVNTNKSNYTPEFDTLAVLFEYIPESDSLIFRAFFSNETGIPILSMTDLGNGMLYGTTERGFKNQHSGGVWSYNTTSFDFQMRNYFSSSINGFTNSPLTILNDSILIGVTSKPRDSLREATVFYFNINTNEINRKKAFLNFDSYFKPIVGYRNKGSLIGVDPIQWRLDEGESPFEIFQSNKDLLPQIYGKRYQGGLIAQLDTTTGAGFVVPYQDQNTARFGCSEVWIGGSYHKSIGMAKQNTLNTLDRCSSNFTKNAQFIASNLSFRSYRDWYLPTKDELAAMYENLFKADKGNFKKDGIYWTSTVNSAHGRTAYAQTFNSTGTSLSQAISTKSLVRAIRYFGPHLYDQPTVEYASSIVTDSSFRIFMKIDTNLAAKVTSGTIYYSTSISMSNEKSYDFQVYNVPFSEATLPNLMPGTQYFFQLQVSNANRSSLRTRVHSEKTLPKVTTAGVESPVNGDTVLCSMTITSQEHVNINQAGYCWKVGTTGTPSINNNSFISSGSAPTYNDTLPPLLPNTKYTMVAYIELVDGTILFGNKVQFHTKATPTISNNVITPEQRVYCALDSLETINVTVVGRNAVGLLGPVTYQWQALSENGVWSTISDENKPSYKFTKPGNLPYSQKFRRIVQINGSVDTSNIVTVRLIESTSPKPLIIEQPYLVGGKIGLLARFSNGLPIESIEWLSFTNNSWNIIPDESSTLFIPENTTEGSTYRANARCGQTCPIVSSKTIGFTPPDPDSNIYLTTRMGNNLWTINNLRTSKISGGQAISKANKNGWTNGNESLMAWYDNDSTSHAFTYGALYNYSTIKEEKICPENWSVPTASEWKGADYVVSGINPYGAARHLKSTTLWSSYNNIAPSPDLENFSAQPTGKRDRDGDYSGLGTQGYWWTAKSTNPSSVHSFNSQWMSSISGDDCTNDSHEESNNQAGYAVRCTRQIKDSNYVKDQYQGHNTSSLSLEGALYINGPTLLENNAVELSGTYRIHRKNGDDAIIARTYCQTVPSSQSFPHPRPNSVNKPRSSTGTVAETKPQLNVDTLYKFRLVVAMSETDYLVSPPSPPFSIKQLQQQSQNIITNGNEIVCDTPSYTLSGTKLSGNSSLIITWQSRSNTAEQWQGIPEESSQNLTINTLSSDTIWYRRLVRFGQAPITYSNAVYLSSRSPEKLNVFVSNIDQNRISLTTSSLNGALPIWEYQPTPIANFQTTGDTSSTITLEVSDTTKRFRVKLLYANNQCLITSDTFRITPPDGNNNIYAAVSIKGTYWTLNNLNTTYYNNKQGFSLSTSINEWEKSTQASAIKPSKTGTSRNPATGLIYNHATITSAENVCPDGWQIPSIEDWNKLINEAKEIAPLHPASALKFSESHYNWIGNNKLNFNARPTRNIVSLAGNNISWLPEGESVSWWATTNSEVLPITQVTMSNQSNALQLIESDRLSSRSLGAAIRCVKSPTSDFPTCDESSLLTDVDMWYVARKGAYYYDGGINYWNSSSLRSKNYSGNHSNTSGLVMGPDLHLYGARNSKDGSILFSFDPIYYRSFDDEFLEREYRYFPYREKNTHTYPLLRIHNSGAFEGNPFWASNNKMYGVITSPDSTHRAITSLIYQVDSGMVNPIIIDTLQSNTFSGDITQGVGDSLFAVTFNPTNQATLQVYSPNDFSNPHIINFPSQIHHDTLCAHYVRPLGGLLNTEDGPTYGIAIAEKVDSNCATFNDTVAAIFQYSKRSEIQFIHYFTRSVGIPNQKLIQGNNGIIYGTTYGSEGSGLDSGGYVFSYNPITKIYQNEVSFNAINGSWGCQAGLTQLTPTNYMTGNMSVSGGDNKKTTLIEFNIDKATAKDKVASSDYNIGYDVRNSLTKVDALQERLDQGESPFVIARSFGYSPDKLYGKIYQGGMIAHLDLYSDSGFVVSTEDLTKLPFGCSNLSKQDFTLSDKIGYGKANTDSSLKFCPSINNAQAAAINYVTDGYSDWYLPSLVELEAIKVNLASNCIGNFMYGNYWSSSRKISGTGRQLNMKDDSISSTNWLERNHVRPIRTILGPPSCSANIDSIYYEGENNVVANITILPNEHYVNHSVLVYDTVPDFNSSGYGIIELLPKSGRIDTTISNNFLVGSRQYFKVIVYTAAKKIYSPTVSLDVKLALQTSTVGKKLAPNYAYIKSVAISGPEHVVKHKGICWDTKKHPRIEKDDTIQVSNHLLTFWTKLPEIQLNKTYFARTFFIDSNDDVFYGNEISFTAVSPQPITTNEILTPSLVNCQYLSPHIIKMPPATGPSGNVYYRWQKRNASNWFNISDFTTDPNLTPVYSDSVENSSPYRRIAFSTGIMDTSNTIYISQLPSGKVDNVIVTEESGASIGEPVLKATLEHDLGTTSYAWYMSGPLGNFTRMENETSSRFTPPYPDSAHFYRAVLSYGGGCPITSSKLISYTPKDGNGRPYATVRVFAQFWTISNSTATIYQNTKTAIPEVKSSELWSSTTKPGYCWFDNVPGLFDYPYGVLYNGYTINSTNNICPSGYHVAKPVDWNTLNSYVGGPAAETAGRELKTRNHWSTPNDVGSNSHNFNALPGGFRDESGEFNSHGNAGHWWPDSGADRNIYFEMIYNSPHNFSVEASNITNEGRSIRCIKNIQ